MPHVFDGLFAQFQADKNVPKITLNEWLSQRNLEKCKHLLSLHRTTSKGFSLDKSGELNPISDEEAISYKIIIDGEGKHTFTFDGEVPMTIINKDYRYTQMGKYYLLHTRKGPFKIFLYVQP